MLIKREMALDQDIGLNGALFGGDMMANMDQTAGITASLVSYNRRFVTRKESVLARSIAQVHDPPTTRWS